MHTTIDTLKVSLDMFKRNAYSDKIYMNTWEGYRSHDFNNDRRKMQFHGGRLDYKTTLMTSEYILQFF